MKKLFFLLLVSNLLVYLGGRLLFPAAEPVEEIAGGGDIRFLTNTELMILRATATEPESVADPVAESDTDQVVDAGDEVERVSESEEQQTDIAQAEDPRAKEQTAIDQLQSDKEKCAAMGPVGSEQAAKSLARMLAEQNMAGIVRWEDTAETTSYWVILPADSDSEAANLMKQLRDAGQGDLWWIPEGELAGDISVGVFRNRDNAEVRRKQISAVGLSAQVVERKSDRKRYWIDLRSEASQRVDVGLMDKLRRKYPDLTVIARRCPVSPL